MLLRRASSKSREALLRLSLCVRLNAARGGGTAVARHGSGCVAGACLEVAMTEDGVEAWGVLSRVTFGCDGCLPFERESHNHSATAKRTTPPSQKNRELPMNQPHVNRNV